MNKTEIYKSLEKPAPASTSMASLMIDTAQVVEALHRANVETAQDLSEHLKPVSTSLAALADAANRGLAERFKDLEQAAAKIARMHDMAGEVTRKAEASIEAAIKKHDAALAKINKRRWGVMGLVAALAGPLSVSTYSVLRNHFSGPVEAAMKWATFENAVLPRMGQRCRTELNQIWQSSSGR
jgi:hypothetical protein